MKKAVDMFSGTGSATKAFQESDDWEVFRVEKDEELVDKFGAELQADILNLTPEDFPNEVDFVWASPPCTKFSIAAVGHHWSEETLPKKQEVVKHVELLYHTLWLIQELNPDYWFLENPRGMMRKVAPIQPQGTVTYCQYGEDYMKPTDLFGVHPKNMKYKSCRYGSGCHQKAPRGSDKGLQGIKENPNTRSSFQQDTWNFGDAVESRAQVPYKLSKQILKAVENPGKRKRQSRIDEVKGL